jgi:hypothetical protein
MSQGTDFSFRKDAPILAGMTPGCSVDNSINDISATVAYPNGIAFSGFDLVNQRIPADVLAAKVQSLTSAGIIPDNKKLVDDQIAVDSQFYKTVSLEYCYYENRYTYLLKKYLKLLMSDIQSDLQMAQSVNGSVVDLNKKLQSLLEIMNFISNDRAKRVDGYREHLKSGNVIVNSNLDKLTALKTQLGQGNLKLTTQKEMQKFTEEKNRALRVQITVFAVLNVVALGVVYTAYNQMR